MFGKNKSDEVTGGRKEPSLDEFFQPSAPPDEHDTGGRQEIDAAAFFQEDEDSYDTDRGAAGNQAEDPLNQDVDIEVEPEIPSPSSEAAPPAEKKKRWRDIAKDYFGQYFGGRGSEEYFSGQDQTKRPPTPAGDPLEKDISVGPSLDQIPASDEIPTRREPAPQREQEEIVIDDFNEPEIPADPVRDVPQEDKHDLPTRDLQPQKQKPELIIKSDNPNDWGQEEVQSFFDDAKLSYEILDFIGRGGFGQVWKATDTVTGEERAIKLVPGKINEVLWEAVREAAVTRSLEHPNIVKSFDTGRINAAGIDTLFIAMEYLKGDDFKKVMEKEGPIAKDPSRTLKLAYDFQNLLAGLYHMHLRNIGHFDIKPANLMHCEDSLVKLMDLGLSRGGSTTSVAGFGTPRWMHVDQARGRFVNGGGRVNTFLDLYAMAISLGDVAMGRYVGENRDIGTPGDPINILVLESYLEEINKELDPTLVSVIETAAKGGYASAKEMCNALEKVVVEYDNTYDNLMYRAMRKENDGDLTGAIGLYEQAKAKAETPEDEADALFYIGNLDLRLGKEKEAEAAHKAAVEKNPGLKAQIKGAWKYVKKIF